MRSIPRPPWTPDWLTLRLIEQELRSEWERLVTDDAQVGSDGVTREGQEARSRVSRGGRSAARDNVYRVRG